MLEKEEEVFHEKIGSINTDDPIVHQEEKNISDKTFKGKSYDERLIYAKAENIDLRKKYRAVMR